MEEKDIINQEGDKTGQNMCSDFVFVSDDLFIFREFEIESKLSGRKLLEIAFNQIVENSPFPIEQLCWGIIPCLDRENTWIWYAGLKERIAECSDENDKHVLPYAVLGLFLAKQKEKLGFSLGTHTSVIVDGMPKLFLAKDYDFSSLKADLMAEDENLPLRYIKVRDLKLTKNNDYKLSFVEQLDGEGTQEGVIFLPNDKVWLADVRDKELIKELKRQQKINYVSSNGIKWFCGLLGVIFVLQTFIFLGRMGVTWKRCVQKRLQPVANKIENQDSLVRQMQAMVEQEMRPFELLGLLNSYRPKNIYFSTATIDNAHNIIVEAVAETAMSVKQYVQVLQDSGKFESVTVDNINVSSQGTKFKLTCDFKETKGHYFLNLKETL